MGSLGEMPWLESPEEDLFEIFDLDGLVLLNEEQKRASYFPDARMIIEHAI